MRWGPPIGNQAEQGQGRDLRRGMWQGWDPGLLHTTEPAPAAPMVWALETVQGFSNPCFTDEKTDFQSVPRKS